MWYRENIPLAVMTVASAAILFFFAVSESALPSSPLQHDGCGWSEDAAGDAAALPTGVLSRETPMLAE